MEKVDESLAEAYKHLDDVTQAIASAESSPTKTLPSSRKRVKRSPVKKTSTLSELYSIKENLEVLASKLEGKGSGCVNHPRIQPEAVALYTALPQYYSNQDMM